VRVLTTVEEHGAKRQLLRARSWPRVSPHGLTLALFFLVIAGLAVWSGTWLPALVIGAGAFLLGARILFECGAAMSSMLSALNAAVVRVPEVTEAEEDDPSVPRTSPVVARQGSSPASVAVAQFEVEG